jgi:hypothetical protein
MEELIETSLVRLTLWKLEGDFILLCVKNVHLLPQIRNLFCSNAFSPVRFYWILLTYWVVATCQGDDKIIPYGSNLLFFAPNHSTTPLVHDLQF